MLGLGLGTRGLQAAASAAVGQGLVLGADYRGTRMAGASGAARDTGGRPGLAAASRAGCRATAAGAGSAQASSTGHEAHLTGGRRARRNGPGGPITSPYRDRRDIRTQLSVGMQEDDDRTTASMENISPHQGAPGREVWIKENPTLQAGFPHERHTLRKGDRATGNSRAAYQRDSYTQRPVKRADEGSKPRRRLAVPVRQIYTESGNSGKWGRRQEVSRRALNGVAGAAGPAL